MAEVLACSIAVFIDRDLTFAKNSLFARRDIVQLSGDPRGFKMKINLIPPLLVPWKLFCMGRFWGSVEE